MPILNGAGADVTVWVTFKNIDGLSNECMACNKLDYAKIAKMAKDALALRRSAGFDDTPAIIKTVWLEQYKKVRDPINNLKNGDDCTCGTCGAPGKWCDEPRKIIDGEYVWLNEYTKQVECFDCADK